MHTDFRCWWTLKVKFDPSFFETDLTRMPGTPCTSYGSYDALVLLSFDTGKIPTLAGKPKCFAGRYRTALMMTGVISLTFTTVALNRTTALGPLCIDCQAVNQADIKAGIDDRFIDCRIS